jgi:secreted trypsin-like serine protease
LNRDHPVSVAGYSPVSDTDGGGLFLRWGEMRVKGFLGAYSTSDGVTYQSGLTVVQPPGGADLCPGDSGGSVYVQLQGTWYLLAVHSAGSGCGDRGPEADNQATDVRQYKSLIEGSD